MTPPGDCFLTQSLTVIRLNVIRSGTTADIERSFPRLGKPRADIFAAVVEVNTLLDLLFCDGPF